MIIDTMVMAYSVLGVPDFGKESDQVIAAAGDIVAPASVEAELLNVVWLWEREGDGRYDAQSAYQDATGLWTELIPMGLLWPLALDLALSKNHSPYDTLFVAAAQLRETKVVTYDKKLLKLFPDYALTPNVFLGKK